MSEITQEWRQVIGLSMFFVCVGIGGYVWWLGGKYFRKEFGKPIVDSATVEDMVRSIERSHNNLEKSKHIILSGDANFGRKKPNRFYRRCDYCTSLNLDHRTTCTQCGAPIYPPSVGHEWADVVEWSAVEVEQAYGEVAPRKRITKARAY